MSPILFSFGPVEVHSYTVFMLTAVLLVGYLTYREARRRMRFDERTLAVGTIALAGGVVGAKLGMLVFLGPAEFWRQLPDLPAHGATFTGALIGGYIATEIAEPFFGMRHCIGDLVAPFLPLGQAIGRLGNFLAADAYGSPTSLPWGVYQAGASRHPVALYEAGLDLGLFAFLMWRRPRTFRQAELFQLYLVGYSAIRFPMEFLRYQPTPRDFLGLTLVQWLCIGGFIWFGAQLLVKRSGGTCVCELFAPRKRKLLVEG